MNDGEMSTSKRRKSTPMKAIVCTHYGPPEVLQLREVEKPTPRNNEVCIKIFATAVTASDIFIRGSQIPINVWLPMRLMIGLTKPRKPILGLVLSGDIESVGKDVKRFRKGDHVYGLTGLGLGTYAEYKCMPEEESLQGCLAIKPENITYEEAAAAAYGGLLALQYLEKGNIQSGEKVLIYGASGSIGTTAVQLAKYFGAIVTGVCSTTNVALVKSLGADTVIDYTKEDSLRRREQYDFILDAVGKRKSSKLKLQCKKALTPNGKYISVDDGRLKLRSERLVLLKEFIEAGHLKPVIDRGYPLERIAEAHRYVEIGHKKGSVVITVQQNNHT
jgi:NADPH:quinone reductase-like Zn-dependent oxidoreductase